MKSKYIVSTLGKSISEKQKMILIIGMMEPFELFFRIIDIINDRIMEVHNGKN